MKQHDYLQEIKNAVEAKLSALVPQKDGAPHSSLYEAARYSLLGGGKRLRPILTIATAQALGASIDTALQPACALEIIHTYSLIHDDLPCMDDDDLRRGKPTLHKVYSQGHAVLTGDFLLTLAFEVIATAPDLSCEIKVELIRILSQSAGADGMVGGQAVDLLYEGEDCDLKTLSFIHQSKTAALIAAAIEFGAVIAGASLEQRERLKSIGYKAGLSFQIVDDILDVTGDEKELGKPLLSDIHNQKSTSVSLLGLEKAQALAEELMLSVEKEYSALQISSDHLSHILLSLTRRSF